jgi:hypothetical protein
LRHSTMLIQPLPRSSSCSTHRPHPTARIHRSTHPPMYKQTVIQHHIKLPSNNIIRRVTSCGVWCRKDWYEFTDVLEVHNASFHRTEIRQARWACFLLSTSSTLRMEAECCSETSVDFYRDTQH